MKRDGQMDAGLESGNYMKKGINPEKILGNKPIPEKGTPPWPKAPTRSAGGNFKWKG
jgi:hypothetical protein